MAAPEPPPGRRVQRGAETMAGAEAEAPTIFSVYRETINNLCISVVWNLCDQIRRLCSYPTGHARAAQAMPPFVQPGAFGAYEKMGFIQQQGLWR